MIWNDCKLCKPDPMTEVLVWIDGKRGSQPGETMSDYSCDERMDEVQPLNPTPEQEPVFTPRMIEAIYAAWHGAGVDIAGGNWARFVGRLPRA